MGSSSSHKLHGPYWKEFKGSVRGKLNDNASEEQKLRGYTRKNGNDSSTGTSSNENGDHKVIAYDDIVYPIRERNDKSFYAPRYKNPGIKHPTDTKLPTLKSLEDSGSSEKASEEEEENEVEDVDEVAQLEQSLKELNHQSEINTPTIQQKEEYKRAPSRKFTQDLSETTSQSFLDLKERKRKPKAKHSDQSLTNYTSLSDKQNGGINEILKALKICNQSNNMATINLLKENQHSLKTALLRPVGEFVKEKSGLKPDLAAYSKYSPTEE